MSNCENCTEKCPMAERAHEAAVGRMYAMTELVRMVKEKEKPPVTNADRIRAMSDEELAEWAYQMHCGVVCPDNGAIDCRYSCRDCWLDWLRSPAEVEEVEADNANPD